MDVIIIPGILIPSSPKEDRTRVTKWKMANWCQMVKHLTGGCLLALTATSEVSHSPTSGKTTPFGVKDCKEKDQGHLDEKRRI